MVRAVLLALEPDPDQALRMLTELTNDSEDVAMVLHPQATCALLVQSDVWTDTFRPAFPEVRFSGQPPRSDAPIRRH